MPKKITMRHIAEQTGLSKFAVSRALAAKSGVSEETRQRVIEAAEALGYERGSRGADNSIALYFGDRERINSELFLQIQNGVQTMAREMGYDIDIFQCDAESQLIRSETPPLGLIAAGDATDMPALQDMYDDIPIIRIGGMSPVDQVDIVRGSNYEDGFTAAKMLLDHGHRKLAFVHGQRDFRGRQDRLLGFQNALADERGVSFLHIRWTRDETLSHVLDTILEGNQAPTGYFCAHDGLAVMLNAQFGARGIRVPQQASIIGYGDYSTAQDVVPGLTTFRVRGVQVGYEAVRLLDRRIREPEEQPAPIQLQVSDVLVKRQSVGPVQHD